MSQKIPFPIINSTLAGTYNWSDFYHHKLLHQYKEKLEQMISELTFYSVSFKLFKHFKLFKVCI